MRPVVIVDNDGLSGGQLLRIILSVPGKIIKLKDEITLFFVVDKFDPGIIRKALPDKPILPCSLLHEY